MVIYSWISSVWDYLIFWLERRHSLLSATSKYTGVGDAVGRWTNAPGVRTRTERPDSVINNEKLRVSTNRPASTSDAHPDPSASSWEWHGEEEGAEKTQEKVASFPRKESLLLRWTDHSGPTEWGPSPYPGSHPRHKWFIFYIWVSSSYIIWFCNTDC